MKDIPGFNGRYAITENGDIYTLPRLTPQGHKIYLKKLKTFIGTTGYKMVPLNDGKKTKMVRVHRLLAFVCLTGC